MLRCASQVLRDLKWYLVFVVLTIGGFASAFYVLFQQDRRYHEVRTWQEAER